MSEIFDPRPCHLGEGPLWHPAREQLFWFDILGKRLLSRGVSHQFDEHVSAAGWVSEDILLIASESALFHFDLSTGTRTNIVELEADKPQTRSNDGRADPQGGFWIGTMGKAAEPGAGAIYRYFDGSLKKLFSNITVPNSICFSPDGKRAYFTDTETQVIQVVTLDQNGWPATDPRPFVDLTKDGTYPDGSVIDAAGNLWNAEWGNGRVTCYDPSGDLIQSVDLPAKKTTCPAFGGPELADLYVTSALDGQPEDGAQGLTFVVPDAGQGQAEHRVILP